MATLRGIRVGWLALTATLLSIGTAAGAQQPAGELVDGIAAVVNGEVISIGELERAVRWLRARDGEFPATGCGGLAATALAPDETVEDPAVPTLAPGRASPAEGEEADLLERTLECLIDGALVFREVRRFPQIEVTRETVLEGYDRLAESWGDPETFARVLERNGMTADELRRELRRQLLVASYVDSRFRTTVDIGDEEARSYFDEVLAPDMESRGIEPPSYDAVAETFVVPILREREVNRRVESWIEDLRSRAEIDVRYPEERDP